MNIDRCPCVSVIPSCIGGSLTTSGESSGGGVSAWLRCASWHVSNQHGEQNFCHFDRSVCKHAALASVWLSNPGCTAWIGLQKCHLWQAGSSKKTAGSVQKTPSGKHHLGTWSIITPGSRVTDTCTFSQTCNYIRNMWADSSTPHCFHVFFFFFFFPSSELTPVTDWLDDLSIDLPDPSWALPSDAPDGRSSHRSLRRILSCISQDKQALIAKGKARRNRGVPPHPPKTNIAAWQRCRSRHI